MVKNLGHFGKGIRNIWEVFKCGAGEEWRRSVGLFFSKLKRFLIESRRRVISYVQ